MNYILSRNFNGFPQKDYHLFGKGLPLIHWSLRFGFVNEFTFSSVNEEDLSELFLESMKRQKLYMNENIFFNLFLSEMIPDFFFLSFSKLLLSSAFDLI